MNQQFIASLQQQIEQLRLPVNRDGLTALLKQKIAKFGKNVLSTEETPEVPVKLEVSVNLEGLINNLQNEISSIRRIVSLKADISINYEKITNDATKRHLLIDNLSMEQSALDVMANDASSIYNFCSKATLQIENLLNYFYWRRYPNFKDLIELLKLYNTSFHNGKEPRKISDVELHSKMNAFEQEFHYPFGIQDSKLIIIRKVRNLDSHRCSVLLENYDEHFAKFQELKEKCARFHQQSGKHFPKTPVDKKVEEQGELAEFIKNRNYGVVREEVRELYERVTSILPPLNP